MMSAAPYESILVATTNLGKSTEIETFLKGCALRFINLRNLPPADEPEENGATFADNAIIKARYYSRIHNLPVVADDSGLMVDALDGAPGVYSSRLVAPGTADTVRNEKLLSMLAQFTRADERRAKFVCAACFIDRKKNIEIVEKGELSGHIGFSQTGDSGFGFDPLFIPAGYNESLATMGSEVKNRISHRKKAFEKLAGKILSSRE